MRANLDPEGGGRVDVVKMYPAEDVASTEADNWTWEAHLKAAEAYAKIGKPYGIGVGTTANSVDTAGALFAASGAELVNKDGDVALDSDAIKEVFRLRRASGEVSAEGCG